MLVAAGGDEARVVGGDGEGEDGVAVGVVGLDQAGFGDCGVGFLGVVEVDGAVGGAGEELGGRGVVSGGFGLRGGVGENVHIGRFRRTIAHSAQGPHGR